MYVPVLLCDTKLAQRKLLHTSKFFLREVFTHSKLFKQISFYTQRSFYTWQAFTHKNLLHTASFHTQQAFTHRTLTHSAFTHGKRLHTLDKNGSLYDPAGTEFCDMHISILTKIRMSIYIYMGLWWPPAASYNCAQVRHHSPAGTFTRVPGRCLRWSPTSQGPRWPPAYRCISIEVLHLYRCVTHTHTHTLPLAG